MVMIAVKPALAIMVRMESSLGALTWKGPVAMRASNWWHYTRLGTMLLRTLYVSKQTISTVFGRTVYIPAHRFVPIGQDAHKFLHRIRTIYFCSFFYFLFSQEPCRINGKTIVSSNMSNTNVVTFLNIFFLTRHIISYQKVLATILRVFSVC